MNNELTGDQALAFGALHAGVKVVTSYPGTPGSGTAEVLMKLAREHNFYAEWSVNERVALEMAVGASIAGSRSLVCAKSVGLNVMLDPLMVLNYTGVHGGLVIIVGDDPGAYGSQNDQDSRPLAHMVEIPMLEPATPSLGYQMIKDAFELSERFKLPILLREVRSFSQAKTFLDVSFNHHAQPCLGIARQPYRFFPYPGNAVEMHHLLHERLRAFEGWLDEGQFNRISGAGNLGILAVGFVAQKLRDALEFGVRKDVRVLELETLYPLPKRQIIDFLDGCNEVLVLEEIEPFIENHLKSLAYELGFNVRIMGKTTGHIIREGELFRWEIQKALRSFIPNWVPVKDFQQDHEDLEKPVRENHCRGCPYEPLLDLLVAEAKNLGFDPFLIADPGCLVKLAGRLDAKFVIGSAVAVADGILKAGYDGKVVALFGDSAYFHSALPAICNAVVNRSNILMLVLENGGAVTTGTQPSPNTGFNALEDSAPRLGILKIANACGVSNVFDVPDASLESDFRAAFREALSAKELTLMRIKVQCDEDFP